jgi:hypothetical protein
MSRRVVYQARLAIPETIGTATRIVMPQGTRILAVMWTGSRLELSCEQPREKTVDVHRGFLVVPGDVTFDLPEHAQYVGTVYHPNHGAVHVYDVSPD